MNLRRYQPRVYVCVCIYLAVAGTGYNSIERYLSVLQQSNTINSNHNKCKNCFSSVYPSARTSMDSRYLNIKMPRMNRNHGYLEVSVTIHILNDLMQLVNESHKYRVNDIIKFIIVCHNRTLHTITLLAVVQSNFSDRAELWCNIVVLIFFYT